MIYRIAAIFCMLLVITNLQAQTSSPNNSKTELQGLLDKVRIQSGVQGIAVSIVELNEPEIILTSGLADITTRIPVKANTQFRFGSIAKMLVASSIMKLVEQNSLSLDDNVRDLIPEIQFNNTWAEDHPLKVYHLLNHTTGWDAMHFAENIPQENSPISIEQALNIHPDSRDSRWPPGSRFAYNNTGYLVAAFIVEKLSGVRYESYIKTQFFKPLSMGSSNFFYTDSYREHAATLYKSKQALPYAHFNNRPAGALNSNILDMSKLVRFFLTQGEVTSNKILPPKSFEQLQNPSGSSAAKAGMEFTYSQGVNQFHANGYVLYGHEGSIQGGSALLVYQPEIGKGYVIAVNGTGPAVAQIHTFLANMITQPIKSKNVEGNQQFTKSLQALSGFYQVINPTASLVAPFTTLMPWKLKITQNHASIGPVFGMKARQLKPNNDKSLSHAETNKIVLVKNEDPLVGSVLQYGPLTLKPVSTISAFLPICAIVLWCLTILSSVIFALIWVPRKILGKISNTASIKLRSWPLISLFPLLGIIFLLLNAKASPAIFELIGQPSWLSISIFVLSIMFFVGSMWSMYVWWKISPQPINRFVYWQSSLLIVLNVTLSLYFLINGLIGIRLWA